MTTKVKLERDHKTMMKNNDSKKIVFSATVELFPGTGGWHFVRLPNDVLNLLREISRKNGNVPVRVTVGKTVWPSTIMSIGDQQWFVAVKASVRKQESIGLGDKIKVGIEPDFSRL